MLKEVEYACGCRKQEYFNIPESEYNFYSANAKNMICKDCYVKSERRLYDFLGKEVIL